MCVIFLSKFQTQRVLEAKKIIRVALLDLPENVSDMNRVFKKARILKLDSTSLSDHAAASAYLDHAAASAYLDHDEQEEFDEHQDPENDIDEQEDIDEKKTFDQQDEKLEIEQTEPVAANFKNNHIKNASPFYKHFIEIKVDHIGKQLAEGNYTILN